MSVTYPADPAKPYGDRLEARQIGAAPDEPFVPVYARRGKARGGQGPVKTWMILTPVAVLVLGAVGATLVMSGNEEAPVPLVEPAATAPVLSAAPAPAETAAPLARASEPAPAVATPAVRETSRPRLAPVRHSAAPPRPAAAAARTATPAPAVPAGPRPYLAPSMAPSTSTLNTAPASTAPTPSPAPPPPVIVVEPAG